MPTEAAPTAAGKILAVVEDLLFVVKINDAAKRAGRSIEFLKSEQDVLEKARDQPSVILIDLNCASVDCLKLIASLKSSPETKSVQLIAYVSHVEGERKRQAQEAGCDMVLARSAFSQNLVQLLQRQR
jgi:CheY-like chemotaxis protein